MTRCTHALTIACLLLLPANTPAQGVHLERSDTRTAVGRREPLLEQAVRLSTSLVATRDQDPRSGNDPSGPRQRRRTPRQRILGAVVGGTGGFFAGGYLGAWIEGDRCLCDDPGLKGALIGAPIGAAAGGVLGGLYLF